MFQAGALPDKNHRLEVLLEVPGRPGKAIIPPLTRLTLAFCTNPSLAPRS